MDSMVYTWLGVLCDFGPILGVVLFFIWRDWCRETKLSDRVEKLEDYQKTTLAQLVERSTAAISQSSEIIKWIGRMLERVPTECPYIEPPLQKMPKNTEQ